MAETLPPSSTISRDSTAFAQGTIVITNNCKVSITTPTQIERPATQATQTQHVNFTITQSPSCADIGSRIAYWSEGSQSPFRMVNTSNPNSFYTFTTVSESSVTDTLRGRNGKQYSLAKRGVKNLNVSIQIPKTNNYIPGNYTIGLNAGLVMN
ncbi:hypothetical protein [Escherichia coli]|uniref:hypothetical protein n=1 Tax=Escherichia coli TaxID=562 RepID=UPI001F248E9F|nr:hypothetical protein [Escherichia coli]MCF7232164.1 hypothetical protein [Escherichia coli]